MVGKLDRGNKRWRRKKRGAPRESAEGRDRETGEHLTRTKIFSRAEVVKSKGERCRESFGEIENVGRIRRRQTVERTRPKDRLVVDERKTQNRCSGGEHSALCRNGTRIAKLNGGTQRGGETEEKGEQRCLLRKRRKRGLKSAPPPVENLGRLGGSRQESTPPRAFTRASKMKKKET